MADPRVMRTRADQENLGIGNDGGEGSGAVNQRTQRVLTALEPVYTRHELPFYAEFPDAPFRTFKDFIRYLDYAEPDHIQYYMTALKRLFEDEEQAFSYHLFKLGERPLRIERSIGGRWVGLEINFLYTLKDQYPAIYILFVPDLVISKGSVRDKRTGELVFFDCPPILLEMKTFYFTNDFGDDHNDEEIDEVLRGEYPITRRVSDLALPEIVGIPIESWKEPIRKREEVRDPRTNKTTVREWVEYEESFNRMKAVVPVQSDDKPNNTLRFRYNWTEDDWELLSRKSLISEDGRLVRFDCGQHYRGYILGMADTFDPESGVHDWIFDLMERYKRWNRSRVLMNPGQWSRYYLLDEKIPTNRGLRYPSPAVEMETETDTDMETDDE